MDLIGIYLREAIQESGCPVCKILKKYEEDIIGQILYEHVNNPSVREKFAESLGLCTYHAWKMKEIAYSNPLYGGLGVAIIYEHMLSIYINSLKSGKNLEEKKCYLCDLVETKEQHTIEALADRFSELIGDYKDSEAILCKKHYEELMPLLRKRSPKLADKLREIQIEKLERIKGLMRAFIEKFDYCSKETPTERETTSVLKAIESLKGLPLEVNFVKKQKPHSIFRGVFLGNRD
ncbi:MAG: hypothetical protein H0Z18_01200 [Thermococcus sp.]|uniref:DUF6062 family protein n=1 Tax=Thermococcus sp. TaxID=35749 RepID=UPI001D3DD352|nr:DUF6062 family protein [Thermococcus sp.]MBO8173854.1 hypothetical protein [Thermococcus sp.]